MQPGEKNGGKEIEMSRNDKKKKKPKTQFVHSK